MWSIVLMIFCAIILSENYLESFQNLLSMGETGAATRTSCSRLMVMATTNADESRIHKRGELRTRSPNHMAFDTHKNMIRILAKNIYFIQFAATFALTQSNSIRPSWWYARDDGAILLQIYANMPDGNKFDFSIVLCGVRCNRECILSCTVFHMLL